MGVSVFGTVLGIAYLDKGYIKSTNKSGAPTHLQLGPRWRDLIDAKKRKKQWVFMREIDSHC